MTSIEYAILAILFGVVAWLIAAIIRHDKQRALSCVYLYSFEKLCDDETVNVELLENMQKIFAVSCRYCAAATIFSVILRFELDRDFRKSVETKSLVDVKTLTPVTKKNIIVAYENLFLFASYSLPMFGWIVRLLINKTGQKAVRNTKPGVFMAAGHRIVYA